MKDNLPTTGGDTTPSINEIIKEFHRYSMENIDKVQTTNGISEWWTTAGFKSHRQSIYKELIDAIEVLKCNEDKVKVFGKGMDSWEARSYDDKSLVNAVLKDVAQIIKQKQEE